MKMTIKTVVVAVIAAAVYGCAQYGGSVASLRGADTATADVAPTDFKTVEGKRPGSNTLISRTFKEQPPLIPHAVDNFDEISVADNQCLECHSPQTAAAKEAPAVFETHLIPKTQTVNNERYQCTSCHVPQVDAQPLITNNFIGDN